MLAYSDPVASIIPAASLDSPSDSAMTALTRLALGPVNTDYYLAVFERFDSTGRTTTTWNWAACLATINWMLFRQLWSAALIYVAAAQGLALVMFGIGRSFLQWPPGVELGVLGAFAVLAFAVPGLYGNAILYADIRKRVARALAAARTLPEACVVLEQQASSRKRLRALVVGNGVLLAAAALAYLLWAPSGTQPLALEPAVTVAQATAAAASAPPPTANEAPVHAEPAAAAPAETTPSAPTPNPNARPETQAEPAEAAASAEPSAPDATADAPPAPSAPTATVAAAAPPAGPARRVAPAAKPTAAKAPASATAPAAAPAPTTTSPPLAAVGTAAGYYINVGLFANEANARKAQARLLNEGLPAFRQELDSPKGRRIRVRVGPYDTRAAADDAASAIRAMALEAVVFKQ